MNANLNKLLAVSGSPLLPFWDNPEEEQFIVSAGSIGVELLDFLRCKNGFFAFESALHVYPLGANASGMNLWAWNDLLTWKSTYNQLITQPTLFFAQDGYGNQFGISSQGVVLFYSEFAEAELLASSLEEWGESVLSDWKGFSGYDLVHEWQVNNRPLEEGERLIPKVPFVLGGKYEVDNLYAGVAVDAMRFRGSLALQLSTIPDGTQVKLKIT